MEWVTVLLLLLLAAAWLWRASRRPRNFPPGLARIPLIGQTFRGSKAGERV